MTEPILKDKMRPSRMVFTFGPGAILDLSDGGSVMIMGIDYWPAPDRIIEPRLAQKLEVSFFGAPVAGDKGGRYGITVRDFPYYRVCTSCHRLQQIWELKDGLYCQHCADKAKAIPPRLVAGCKRGHIQDFPWTWWVGCTCDKGKAQLYLTGGTGDSDLMVECRACHKSENLEGALDILDLGCRGKRPWMGDEEDCDEHLKGLMRGASNVYFPLVSTSLSIPPFSDHLHKMLRDHIYGARDNYFNGRIRDYIGSNEGLRRFMEKEGVEIDDLELAFRQIFEGGGKKGIKEGEYESLTHDVPYHPLNDFQTERLEIKGKGPDRWFRSIRRVVKLREALVLRGFTRVLPGDDGIAQEIRFNDRERLNEVLKHHSLSYLQQDNSSGEKWLPGTEQFGEGIFFEFDRKAIEAWEKDPGVISRCMAITRTYVARTGADKEGTSDENRDEKDGKRSLMTREGMDMTMPRTILLHTFAHSIIRQISASCGYSSASLRERIYSTRTENGLEMCGVLIYTSSSDSEGTLGGLVAQAESTSKVMKHIGEMTGSLTICSQDPLCGAHDPSVTGNPWGASCHSCMHLPETSCEGLQNMFLDRYMMVGTEGVCKGFFDER